jgi:uncharacterized protein YndB with AHSA1/START domain
MTTQQTRSTLAVRKTIVVNVPQAHAFLVFTEKHGSWWPLASHHIGAQAAQTAILEPRAGGRWYERGVDGSECDWGRVLVWDPPQRLVLSWEIGADWKHDSSLSTEVEVRFIAEGPRTTRVELEHRDLERFGEKAQAMRSAFDSEGGWTGILQLFGAAAGAEEISPEAPCPTHPE